MDRSERRATHYLHHFNKKRKKTIFVFKEFLLNLKYKHIFIYKLNDLESRRLKNITQE